MDATLMRRALLTGATGLIGSWTTRAWPEGVLDLVAVGSRDVDLLAPGAPEALVREVEPTDVVHLAWSASGDPNYRESHRNEEWLRSSREIVTAARSVGARCWLTGSVVDDDPVHTGVDAYALSKSRLRQEFARDIRDGTLGWLRPSYVVDEEWERPALVKETVRARREDRIVSLRTPLDRHDFVHAADVGSAIVLAVQTGLTGVLGIGSGRARTVADLVDSLGAEWVSSGTKSQDTAHSGAVADIEWLTSRGWVPRRTDELFQRRDGSPRSHAECQEDSAAEECR